MSDQQTMSTDTITLKDSESLPAATDTASSSTWTSLVPMILIFGVFYFLLIRPQEKRRRMQQELVLGVKKGEEILTNSGIIGIVRKINDSDNTILVEVAKDVEITMQKNAIADITSRTKEEAKQKKIAEQKKNKK